jgi:hypothetical protein
MMYYKHIDAGSSQQPVEIGSIYITAGSSHEPAVTYHCRLKPTASSDSLNITAGSWLEPVVIGIFTVGSFRTPIIFQIFC